MTEAAARSYHTIGEVLSLLQADFPDISISKIRFLEAQGLLDPERTASGYRKFQAHDIDRLRFILREQRDRYLPLKVIRQRLAAWERGELDEEGDPAQGDRAPVEVDENAGTDLDRRGLAAASGLDESVLADLERYGLIEAHVVGTERHYDECGLVIAKLARAFMRHGIEPRHLRMFRQAVDRETDLFERSVAPLAAQRNAEAQAQALTALNDLAGLGRKLRQALVVQNLRTPDR